MEIGNKLTHMGTSIQKWGYKGGLKKGGEQQKRRGGWDEGKGIIGR